MAMFREDRLKAALNMIYVTPENYNNLNVQMIIHCYEVIAETEKQIKEQEEQPSFNGKKDTKAGA